MKNAINTTKKEIGYEEVKAVAYYFFETLSKLAQGSYSAEELKARREKGKATSFAAAIAEIVAPDEIIKNDTVIGKKPNKYQGTYKCYSQRCFDAGICGDPYEYTGINISFKLKNGMGITIDTKYGTIRAQYYKEHYDIGIGKTLMKRLDEFGELLWAEWDDKPDSLIEKLRKIDDEEKWWDEDADVLYMEAETSPDPANSEKPVKYQTQFVRDAKGGIKYTSRKYDGHSGRYFRYSSYQEYADILAEQKRKWDEATRAQIKKYPIKPVRNHPAGKTWENMTEEERENARKRYAEKKKAEGN